MTGLAVTIFYKVVRFFACIKLKSWLGYDDALDTFGVHAVGGTISALLTGLLARTFANSNLTTNLGAFVTNRIFQPLAFEQLKAMGVTLAMAITGTIVIAFGVKALIGLRPSAEEEVQGLDIAEYGEEGYVYAGEVSGTGLGHEHRY